MISIINGTEFSLKLFKEFEPHIYSDNFSYPVLDIWENNELVMTTENFSPEHLFDIWLNLSLSRIT